MLEKLDFLLPGPDIKKKVFYNESPDIKVKKEQDLEDQKDNELIQSNVHEKSSKKILKRQ